MNNKDKLGKKSWKQDHFISLNQASSLMNLNKKMRCRSLGSLNEHYPNINNNINNPNFCQHL